MDMNTLPLKKFHQQKKSYSMGFFSSSFLLLLLLLMVAYACTMHAPDGEEISTPLPQCLLVAIQQF